VNLLLWADAICIDQDNDYEKSWQVAMMKRIYEKAVSVICWLGEGNEMTDKAMTALDRVGKEVMFWPDQDDVRQWVRKVIEGNEMPFPIVEVSCLLQRSWWERTWCLQELVSAKAYDFVCGSQSLNGLVAEKALSAFRELRAAEIHHSSLGERSRTLSQLYFCDDLGRQATMFGTWYDFHTVKQKLEEFEGRIHSTLDVQSKKSSTSLVELLCRLAVNSAKTSDPRDSVYALLGLTSDARELGIEPDYRKSCQSLFEDVASAILIKQKLIRILHACQFPKRQPNLPSWVPDWSSNLDNFMTDHDLEFIATKSLFNAAKVLPAPNVKIERDSQSRLILSLEGVEVDQVFSAGSPTQAQRKLTSYSYEEWTLDTMNETLSISMESLRQWVHQIQDLDQEYARDHEMQVSTRAAIAETAVTGYTVGTEATDTLFDMNLSEDQDINHSSESKVRWLCDQIGSKGRISGRVPFITADQGLLGNGPAGTRKGDLVVILCGLDVPIILRRKEDNEYTDNYFEVIGVAYVVGLMLGNGVNEHSKINVFDLC
jgi:Heterokaryon incompatibility protein (HET)